MSEQTQCNYCRLKSIEHDAKQKKMKVTILCDTKWGMGGFNVYIHPKDVKIAKLPGGEDGEREKYRRSWMQDIGEQCCC